jgi:urease accessory protein
MLVTISPPDGVRPSEIADLSVNSARNWCARLELGFEARAGHGTVLAHRRHEGPLRVQKALYPEGPEVCHALMLHPPAGIAGGDALSVQVRVGEGAKALITTPGAGKWYRSNGPLATQRLEFEVARGGVFEWLPQESIVFDQVHGRTETVVRLAGDATLHRAWICCVWAVPRPASV